MKEYYRVQAEIDLDAIYENIKNTREKLADGVKLMAVIKSDGYGHGAVAVAKTIDSMVDAYAVAILEEAEELRQSGITKPILILGHVPEQQYPALLALSDVMPAIFTLESAQALSQCAVEAGKEVKIHLKVDTGMGRIGFLPNAQSLMEIEEIHKLPKLRIDGCFTHFAKADLREKEDTWKQFHIFTDYIQKIKALGIELPTCHAANSAAIMELPQMHLDMVRSGISTYGLYPSEEVDKKELALQPGMAIRAFISHVKEVEAGTAIGYGGTFVTERRTKVATIPVGYGDGYPRSLSNLGRVLIHGQSARIIGRICMDQFMVDVTELGEVKTGDDVILVGTDGTERISVEELADQSGSFNYEFVCDIGKRIPRVYFRKGKKAGTMDFYHNSQTGLELEI